MSHSYLFFILTLLIYHTFKFHEESKIINRKSLWIIAFFGGWATLIRPTDILFLLFPLLYNIHDLKLFKQKFILLFKNKKVLFIAILLFILPILPQLIYWKIQTGDFLYFSYGNEEGFFFSNPQILKFLFSFRNGLFPYTPLILLCCVGFYRLFKTQKAIAFPITAILIINIYVLSSWWAWWYGGSFGNRSMVQYLPFFSILLALIVETVINRSMLKKLIFVLALGGSIYLNLYQSIQYKKGIIHWDGMNFNAYRFIFLKSKYTNEELKILNSSFTKIDYRKAEKGDDQHKW